jgi:hypothetical protein
VPARCIAARYELKFSYLNSPLKIAQLSRARVNTQRFTLISVIHADLTTSSLCGGSPCPDVDCVVVSLARH